MNGMPALANPVDVPLHAVAAVRRDDAERDVLDVVDAILVRAVHRARVERGDLVVVEVGDDERLRGVGAGDRAHAVAGATPSAARRSR